MQYTNSNTMYTVHASLSLVRLSVRLKFRLRIGIRLRLRLRLRLDSRQVSKIVTNVAMIYTCTLTLSQMLSDHNKRPSRAKPTWEEGRTEGRGQRGRGWETIDTG